MKINTEARQIIEEAEAKRLTHKEMAKMCGVTVGTISRWKSVGRAKSNVIAPLEDFVNKPAEEAGNGRIYLDEASLEQVAARARELGFRSTFTDMNADV